MFFIALDEVGRGALAGPVVTGAIVLPETDQFICEIRNNIPSWKIDGIIIRDSKLLSALQRDRANEWLLEHALAFGIGVGSVTKINTRGIVKATNFAFRSSIKRATKKVAMLPEKLLIDAFFIPKVDHYPKSKQQPIVHGDRLNVHIAAASIIAKVYRDNLMESLGLRKQFSKYEWCKNKGYGTKEHLDAIRKFGTTKHHRNLFVRNINESRLKLAS